MNLNQLPSTIFGMHDPGAEQLFAEAGKHAWIVVSVLATDAPGDFAALTNQGHTVIARLNHGYGSSGSIPVSAEYDNFAQACAHYAAGCPNVKIWIVGNETNATFERPNAGSPQEEVITPARLAQCFAKVRAAIHSVPGHNDDWLIPSPPGPWNSNTSYPGNPAGDWVIYFRDVLNECIKLSAPPDALGLHTYSNHDVGMDGGLVTSDELMNNPAFPNHHWQFRTYRDFLGVVPSSLHSAPVIITEAQHLPWQDQNVGWIQKAFAEIDAWNAVASNQAIQALCLFRWIANPHDDTQAGWSLSDRRRLQDDLRAALQNNYAVRWSAGVAKSVTQTQPTVVTKPSGEVTSSLLPVDKIRWFTEETIRRLEANDGPGANDILINTITPWFYKSYPQHATDLAQAQAQTEARWNTEEATRHIKANNLTQARAILLQHVLPWLTSNGPRELGILGIGAPPPAATKTRKRKTTTPPKAGTKKTRAAVPTAGVLGIGEAVPPAPVSLRDTLLAQGDAHLLLPFNRDAAIQKQIFADGLVPNSTEFNATVENVTYVAQRAEHLLTGQVRVYYAPTTNFGDIRFVTRDAGVPTLNTPFKGGNRITQLFGARPEYYQQFDFAGHEGVDFVPQDGNRDMYCIEEGVIIRDVDIAGDPKTNPYGIHIAVYNAANKRMWYYCHMAENRVSMNQPVRRGDLLGRMGGTGNVQGDHLHLNIKLLDSHGLPLTPNNGYHGWSDPLPLVTALNAADTTSTPLRDALLRQADAGQTISFNTQAALQKQMFSDGFLPNSAEFNLTVDAMSYVAQRGENINTGAVRVYYAPTTNFADIQFVEKA